MPNSELRDGAIHQALEQRRADDTKIMQKVNAVTREAFLVKFPGHIEHTMRLISERLMHCLSKQPGVDLSNPRTWPAQPQEIRDLAQALVAIESLHQRWRV